nr:hypothetical protein [Pelagibaculum spongiae]
MLSADKIYSMIDLDLSRESSLDNFDSINDQLTQVPNMTLHPNREDDMSYDAILKEHNLASGSSFIFVDFDEPKNLDWVMAALRQEVTHVYDVGTEIEFHWGACRVTDLNSTGGKYLGINANMDNRADDGSYRVLDNATHQIESLILRDPFNNQVEKLGRVIPRPTPTRRRPASAPPSPAPRRNISPPTPTPRRHSATAPPTPTPRKRPGSAPPTAAPRRSSPASAIEVIRSSLPVAAPRKKK